jgi:hypothetical protein
VSGSMFEFFEGFCRIPLTPDFYDFISGYGP